VWVHSSVELLALITIGAQLALKLRWTGWAPMLRHKRTVLKVRYSLEIFLRKSQMFEKVEYIASII